MPAPVAIRRVANEGSVLDVPVLPRGKLGAGATLSGPAIVEQDDCTIWVAPGWTGRVDALGNLVLRA